MWSWWRRAMSSPPMVGSLWPPRSRSRKLRSLGRACRWPRTRNRYRVERGPRSNPPDDRGLSERGAAAEVGVQCGGTGEYGAAAGREAGMPVAQRRFKGCDASGGADLGDQRGDLLQPVAAPSELVDQ